ncbi:uncharacterized protein [Heterodontus francisci]|uniref:uncharacterized protein isoform X1 n=1 Tax=Heterodontus francisci TaxID=7792 RepID=UPI00355B8539
MGEKTRLLSNQHWPPGMMRRVKVPRSMLEGSLLKDLNIGQQRYMYSIFTIYKAGPLRRSLHQQYINSLERQRMLDDFCFWNRPRLDLLRSTSFGDRIGLCISDKSFPTGLRIEKLFQFPINGFVSGFCPFASVCMKEPPFPQCLHHFRTS